MTIPGLIILNMLAGASIAFGAKVQIRSLQRPVLHNRYFTALMMLEVSVFLPIGMYYNGFYPDWSWMYMVDTRSVSAGITAMVLAAYPISAVSGYLVSHFSAKSNSHWVALMFMGFLVLGLLMLLIVGYDKIFYMGTYDQYHNNVNLVPSVSTSVLPSVIVTWLGGGVAWGYVLFRFWREGHSTSPHKRR